MYRVFVSSTSRDLEAYRTATIDVCNRLGLVPIGMEFFGAMGAGATAGSKERLDGADVYVGIFAHRYGYIERDHARSVTELEYDYAGERGLDRLCFIADPSYPWPEDAVEADQAEAVRRFKDRVEHERIRVLFTTVEDYRFKLLDTLSQWLLVKRTGGPSLSVAEPPLQMQVFKAVKATRFHFRAQRVPFLGARHELAQAEAFLDSDEEFSWWLLLGEAGAGKSRLALELCVRRKATWRVGFLPRAHDFTSWAYWQPSAPTLMVVDYLHGRASELQAIVAALSGRALPHPVRLLLLERRAEGRWWDQFRGTGTARMANESSQYAEPLKVGPMSDDDLWSSIVTIVEGSTTRGLPERSTFLAAVKAIDPLGRPLFAALAADAWAAGREIRDWDRDALLRDVLQREKESYWNPGGVREKDRNLLTVVTLIGGLHVEDLNAFKRISRDLPTLDGDDPDRFDASRYELFVSQDSREALAPLEPDLIGEFFVLDHVEPKDAGDRKRGMVLNVMAWLARPRGVFEFTTRVIQDFPAHPSLSILSGSGHVVIGMLDDVSEELRDDLLFYVPATFGNLLHSDCEHRRLDHAQARLDLLYEITDRWPEHDTARSVAISMTVMVLVTHLIGAERPAARALSSRLVQRISGNLEQAVLVTRVFGLQGGVLAERGDEEIAKDVFDEACAFVGAFEHHDSLQAALAQTAKDLVHSLIEKEHWPAAAAVFSKAAANLGDRLPAASAGSFGLMAVDLLLSGIGNSLADFDAHRPEYLEIYTLGRPVVFSEAFEEGLAQRHAADPDDPDDSDTPDAGEGDDDSSSHVVAKAREVFDAVAGLFEDEPA